MLNINLCLFDPDSRKGIRTGERILHGVHSTAIPKDGFKKRFLWCLIESDIWTKPVWALSSITATTANNYKLLVLWIIHSFICSPQWKDNVESTRSLFASFPYHWLFQPDTSLIAWYTSCWTRFPWLLLKSRESI